MDDKKPLSTPKTHAMYIYIRIYIYHIYYRMMSKPVRYVLCTYIISIYSIQNDSDIVSTCFNNLHQTPGKILYAKLLRTDPYPISPDWVGSRARDVVAKICSVQTSPEEKSLLLSGRGDLPFTSILFQNVTQGIRGPHGGVANLVHFVRKSFLKRTTKKKTQQQKIRQKTQPLCRCLPILRRLLG